MLSAAVREDNDLAKSEASWVLGLIGDADAFDALMDLSHAPGWKQRSSAMSALAKLKDLSDDRKDALEARVKEIFDDPGEVFYVKKDAAFATGRQGLIGVLPWLIEALESDHYSVRYASAEAMRDLSEDHAEEVYRRLLDRIEGLSDLATANALYAAGELSDKHKLAVIDQVLDGDKSGEIHVGVAVARVLATIEEGRNRQRRADRLLDTLPEEPWQARAMLEPE
jgi:HEAT repeat protein